jgi:hypothetical protein
MPVRLLAFTRLKLLFLAEEISVGSVVLARIGLVTIALGLQTFVILNPGHFRPAPSGVFALAVSLTTLGSLAACLLATMPLKRVLGLRVRQGLAAGSFVGLATLAVVGGTTLTNQFPNFVNGTPYNNDGAAMDLYAAGQLVHGHNPYLQTNIVKALAGINAPSATTTPLLQGQFRGATAYPSDAAIQQVFLNALHYQPRRIPVEFESKYNYPSGSFLFILPFVWAGLQDMRFLYVLALIIMAVYIASRMPRNLRWLVPVIFLADVPIIMLTTGGQPDPIYGLFLMIGYAEWRTPWLSPSFMGLACGTKQLAWFFAPFYLILTAREFGWREALRRGGLMTGITLLMNAPFILRAPEAYFASIGAPMTDPMFPMGIGIIALFVANALPMLPKVAFTVMELLAWLGSSATYARSKLVTPAAAAVFAALPLFFAWRSLVNYFYLVPLLVLAITFAGEYKTRSTALARTSSPPFD